MSINSLRDWNEQVLLPDAADMLELDADDVERIDQSHSADKTTDQLHERFRKYRRLDSMSDRNGKKPKTFRVNDLHPDTDFQEDELGAAVNTATWTSDYDNAEYEMFLYDHGFIRFVRVERYAEGTGYNTTAFYIKKGTEV